MGEIARPRLGEPDDAWVRQFNAAFKSNDNALAMAIVYATIEHDTPKVLALMEYIVRLGDEDESEESAWVDFFDLAQAFGEATRWTMDFQLAITCLHGVAAVLQGKDAPIDLFEHKEVEELADAIANQVRERGFDDVCEEHLAAAFDAAEEIENIVVRTQREVMQALDGDNPAPVLLALGSTVDELTVRIEQLRLTQIVLRETSRWTTAS